MLSVVLVGVDQRRLLGAGEQVAFDALAARCGGMTTAPRR